MDICIFSSFCLLDIVMIEVKFWDILHWSITIQGKINVYKNVNTISKDIKVKI